MALAVERLAPGAAVVEDGEGVVSGSGADGTGGGVAVVALPGDALIAPGEGEDGGDDGCDDEVSEPEGDGDVGEAGREDRDERGCEDQGDRGGGEGGRREGSVAQASHVFMMGRGSGGGSRRKPQDGGRSPEIPL